MSLMKNPNAIAKKLNALIEMNGDDPGRLARIEAKLDRVLGMMDALSTPAAEGERASETPPPKPPPVPEGPAADDHQPPKAAKKGPK